MPYHYLVYFWHLFFSLILLVKNAPCGQKWFILRSLHLEDQGTSREPSVKILCSVLC